MSKITEWQYNEIRSRAERQLKFRKLYFPCDPFSGEWIDGGHLPQWAVNACKLAQERLSDLDRDLKYICYRRRGTAFDDCCVDRYWLKSYLEYCKAQEPEAHEREPG